ncbi:FAD-binding protein [Nocardioidaceae bacterium]|nr:FAD-binding protein [Nocardioidaceae bacterium]
MTPEQRGAARERVRAVFAELDRALLVDDEDLLGSYARDEVPPSLLTSSEPAEAALLGPPALVLLPRTTADVSRMLRLAYEGDVPVVTRGAGSGLGAAATARVDGVVLSTRRMTGTVEVDPLERLAVAQPGVVTAELRTAAAAAGLFYPPDPGSLAWSTIGGNVATNAGGMCCVKYGVTGDYVLALEAVLADGTVLRTGRRTAKGVAGYDLTSLLVGSEGTLAVVTEVTVRLVPAPQTPMTLVASFDSLGRAGEAVEALVHDGVSLSALEVLDRTTLRAVAAHTGMDLGEPAAMLLAQADDAGGHATIARAAGLCEKVGAEVVVSDDAVESAALMEARRQALPALEVLGDWLLDDVCVPRGRVVALLEAVERIAADTGLTIGVFGHAGDGNMHPTLIHDASDPASVAAMRRAFDAVTRAALDLGGTVTGEHGVGRLKRDWLRTELDDGAYAASVALKQALDPRGILNPGAVLPPTLPHDLVEIRAAGELDGSPPVADSPGVAGVMVANPRRTTTP